MTRDPATGRFIRAPAITGAQTDSYQDTLTALSRAVRQAQSDVKNVLTRGGKA